MLSVAVIICGALLGLFLAAIGWAGSEKNLWDSFSYMLDDPWAVVTLFDLGIGLLFVAVWIAVVEPRRWVAAAWIAGLFMLGNATTLAFLLWRSRRATRFADLLLPHHRNGRTKP